jgi:hypothetical protein
VAHQTFQPSLGPIAACHRLRIPHAGMPKMGKGLAVPKQYLGLKSMHLGNFPQVCTALDPRRLKRIANYAKKIAAPCFVEVALKKILWLC